jgi:hypothetical protein
MLVCASRHQRNLLRLSTTEICGAVPTVTLVGGEEEYTKMEAIKARQMSKSGWGRRGGVQGCWQPNQK